MKSFSVRSTNVHRQGYSNKQITQRQVRSATSFTARSQSLKPNTNTLSTRSRSNFNAIHQNTFNSFHTSTHISAKSLMRYNEIFKRTMATGNTIPPPNRGISPPLTETKEINDRIEQLLKDDNLAPAEEALELMRSKGLRPHLITYKLFIGYYSKQKMLDKMWDTYEELLNSRFYVPDAYVHNTVMDALASTKQLDKLNAQYETMVNQPVVPDVHTFNVMIKGHGLEGDDVQTALKWYQKLKTDGITPNQTTFELLFKILCKHNRVEEIVKVIPDMKKFKQIPTKSSLEEIYSTFERTKNGSAAVKLCAALTTNFQLSPSLESFTAMMSNTTDVKDIAAMLHETTKEDKYPRVKIGPEYPALHLPVVGAKTVL